MSDREPILNLPAIVSWSAAFLAAVHFARWMVSEPVDVGIVLTFGFIPARYSGDAGALPGGWWACAWSPVSYSLLHADMLHLTVNVLWMAVFGSPVARRIGAARFLGLAALSSASGALVHAFAYPGDFAVVIGASAAVSGLMGAALRFAFPSDGASARPLDAGSHAYLLPVLPLIRVLVQPRVLAFLLVWLILNVVTGVGSAVLFDEGEAIAWQAHIGGLLTGLLAFRLFDPVKRAA